MKEEKNIIALKQRAEEMLNNNYSRRIGDEEIYTIICEWERILDLYNKEKEKREIAEENHKVLSLDLGQALKELGLYEDTIIADELVLEIKKRYISKDKIREILKYYGYTPVDDPDTVIAFYSDIKKLLEGKNE